MNNIELIVNMKDISILTYIIKIFSISICTYYTFNRITNNKFFIITKLIIISIFTILISMFCGIIKYYSDSFNSIFFLILLLSIQYSIFNKIEIGYTFIITITSLSINYVLFFLGIILDFIYANLFTIQNDYINLGIILFHHIILLILLFKVRKFNNGFTFFNKTFNNKYYDILILNIGITVLFSSSLLTNYAIFTNPGLVSSFIIFSITMFLTIIRTLNMSYKHKLLVQDLEETKIELDNKNKEISELEQENLEINKTNHSIMHKQRALEFKLNELMLKYEIADELDIQDSLDEISNTYSKNTTNNELSKTGITKIDDMLNFMQSECNNNNINFDLQLNGNIHYMTNNFISKEDLEILIADITKNAIIAIKHSDNINRSILVKLGLIDNYYSLYVYDSGVEFEADTLGNLGKTPSSTHLDDGGSGMGFMNIFDTLNKYEASIIINEIGKPSKDNYTKFISIIFDKKNEFIVDSYKDM